MQNLLESGTTPQALARMGVGWLLVERGTPGEMGAAERTIGGLSPAYADSDIALYRIPDAVSTAGGEHRSAVLAAHLVWAATLAAGSAGLAAAGLRRRAQS